MDRRITIGLAAAAAVVGLMYLRSKSASAATAGTGGVLTSNAALLNTAMGNAAKTMPPVTITVNQTKPAVYDNTATAPAPAPAPAPAASSAPRAVFGGTMPGASADTGGYLDAEGWWHYPDGSKSYTGGGTLGHLTPEQRKGRTDGEIITSMLF